MSMPFWFYDLAVYCAQLAVLITAGALMVAITRLREPRLRLVYWQVLLALGVLLPALEPWQTAPPIEQGVVQAGESLAHAGTAGIQAASALPTYAASSFSVYQIISVLLVAGLVFRLLWLGAGLLRLRRSRLRASPLGQHSALEQFEAALGVSPDVLVSEQVSSPVTFGWRTPRVLLPRKFIQMDEARQRAILCHELLHVQRRDWLWHAVEEVLRCLFWFHLAVVWLIAQIRLCREQLVDREVVIMAGSRRDYLDALFEIASSSRASRHAPALLFLRERHLKRRVKLILKETTMSRKKLGLALSACLGGLLLTGVVVVTLLPLKTSAAQIASAVSVNTTTVRPDTHFFGNPDARVTVVEFGDFQCPACRKAAAVGEQLRKNMGSQVRFAYRQFPLTKIHHQAEKAAEAAECAAEQGKFWQAVNYLSDHPLDFSGAGVQKFAADLGLDPSRTAQCLSSGAMAARVRQDISDGRALGIHSVPTLFIGNTKLLGMPSYSQLHALIEQKLQADGNVRSTSPNGSILLASASLAPAFAQGSDGQETVARSQSPRPGVDPKAQDQQDAAGDTKKQENVNVNQKDIQRQVDEAMKQLRLAQQVPVKIDQAKLQEQLDQAMKQLKLAEAAAPKIDDAKINEQIEQAMKQVQVSQDVAPKIDQEKLQEQINQAMKQLEKMNTPEMRQKMKEQMDQLNKMNTTEVRRQIEEATKRVQELNTPEMQQRMQEQMKQLQKLSSAEKQRIKEQMDQLKKMNTSEMRQHMQEQMDRLKKLESPEMRRQFEQAMAQARAAQDGASQENKAELQRQLDEAKKQVEQARKEAQDARAEAQKARQSAMKEAQDARAEAHKARQEAMKARREAEEQRKAVKPRPSAEPKPAPAPPASPAPPAPSAPPAPPKPPESAGIVGGVPGGVVGGVPGRIVGGVPGGVVGGVPGGKVTGVQGGVVKGIDGGIGIGAPGGITGGVITAPHPPVPPSTSSKEGVATPPASTAPSSPPQN